MLSSKLLKLDPKIWYDAKKLNIGVGAKKIFKKESHKNKLQRSKKNLSMKIALNLCQAWCQS